MRELVVRWSGIALCMIGVIATLVLAVSDDLDLYIHPRYTAFTVIMAIIGGILSAWAIWALSTPRVAPSRNHHDHDHRPAVSLASAIIGAAAFVAAAVGLLVVPPASLSGERALTSVEHAAVGPRGGEAPVLVGSDSSTFTVKDWSGLLAQGASAAELAGRRADVTGFVLDAAADASVVYVARYAITCCAVDAQVFAIPVSADSWPTGIRNGEWVRVTGTFADFPGSRPMTRLVIDEIQAIEEPGDPYVF